MFVPVTDHAAQALSRLVTQFRSSDEIRGVLNALSAEIQAAENAAVACFAVRDIDAATGATLTSIGKIVAACPRGTFTDAEYRIRIRVQILVNKSDGTAADLTAIAKAFHPAWGNTVHTREGGQTTAALRVTGNPIGELQSYGSVEVCTVPFNPTNMADQIPLSEAMELARYLKSAVSAGGRVVLKFVPTSIGSSPVFCLADPSALNPTPRGGAGAGFGIGKFAQSLNR